MLPHNRDWVPDETRFQGGSRYAVEQETSNTAREYIGECEGKTVWLARVSCDCDECEWLIEPFLVGGGSKVAS
jgi:hypothetical protein